MPAERLRPRIAALLLTAALSLLLALLLGEFLLRVVLPPHRFLDPNQECFWLARFCSSWDL